MIFMFLLSVFMLHLEGIFRTKNKKASGVILLHSGLEKVYFIFYWKEMIGNSLNDWLDIGLRRRKGYGYFDIGKLLQTFSAAWQVKHFVH